MTTELWNYFLLKITEMFYWKLSGNILKSLQGVRQHWLYHGNLVLKATCFAKFSLKQKFISIFITFDLASFSLNYLNFKWNADFVVTSLKKKKTNSRRWVQFLAVLFYFPRISYFADVFAFFSIKFTQKNFLLRLHQSIRILSTFWRR